MADDNRRPTSVVGSVRGPASVANLNDSTEVLNLMYDQAIDRNKSLQNELTKFKRFHHESMEELMRENQRLRMENEQNRDELTKELNKVQTEMQSHRRHCTAAMQRCSVISNEKQELETNYSNAKKELNKKIEECTRLRQEKEDIERDYNLNMSERDKVHEEINQLNDLLSQTSEKLSREKGDNQSKSEMLCTYRREVESYLRERDKARKDLHDLQDLVKQMINDENRADQIDSSTGSSMLTGIRLSGIYNELNIRQDGNDLEDIRGSKRSSRVLSNSFDNKDPLNENSNKEVEVLKKEISSLSKELTEVKGESRINEQRRNWAFSERDKIVQERESVRRQCDELRKERDRVVSSHAEVLHELDELRKAQHQTSRELKQVKEKLEKEERTNQLIRQSNSRDSAIDNDLQDWDTEILDFQIDISSSFHTNLGLELAAADSEEINDFPLWMISNISKDSVCEGKLNLDDVLLMVNNVDVTHTNKSTVLNCLLSTSNNISHIKIRRRKLLHRLNINVDLKVSKRDVGFSLESGVYISRISPGSALAKEGHVAVGDRILAVDEKPVDQKSAKEVMKMIESSPGHVTLNIRKYGGLAPVENSQVIQSPNSYNRNDVNTGTTKRRFSNLKDFFKRSRRDPDDQDTLRQRTGKVLNILDEINRTAEMEGSGTWPPRGEEVDVSTNGTVTMKPVPYIRNTIPKEFVDHNRVYGPHRNNKSEPQRSVEPDRSQTVRNIPFKPGYHQPKVQTLPGNNSRQPVQLSERSKSLGGHTKRDRTLPSPVINPNDSRSSISHHDSSSSFHTDSVASISSQRDKTVEDLDEKLNEIENIMRHKYVRPGRAPPNNRPSSVCYPIQQVQRTTSPFNGEFAPSPSPHHTKLRHSDSPVNNRFSSNQTFFQTPPHNNSSQNYSRSHHQISSSPSYPSYSPPPPYTVESKIFPNSSIHSQEHVIMTSSYTAGVTNSRHTSPAQNQPYMSQTLDRKNFRDGGFRRLAGEYDTTRVKFPSKDSVYSTKRSINSLELVSSDRSSPLSSPNVSDVYQSSEEFINKHPHRHNKLKEGVLRVLELDTSSIKQLGFKFEEVPGIGIFVSSVTPGGLAHSVGIDAGDQIVEFYGINMLTATYDAAAAVLKEWQSGDGKVQMKVRYNPKRLKLNPDQCNDVDKTSVSGSIQAIHAHMEQNNTSKSRLYTVHSNGSSGDDGKIDPPRKIIIHRNNYDMGIRLCGGNATGVFVADMSPNSPAFNSGLKVGDEILEVNDTNMLNEPAETVAIELTKTDTVQILVQYNINKSGMIPVGGDHFYVRAHFSHEPDTEGHMSINVGDLLLVENSLLGGQVGKWYAWKVDEKDNKLQGGIIPSRIRLEETMPLKRSFSDVMPADDDSKKSRMGSIGRRSFFRRKSGRNQHQRNGSRDSRELTSFSDLSVSSDIVPVNEDGVPLVYQRLHRIQCDVMRPVILIGPFAVHIIRKLISESPDKYCGYEEEFLNTNQQSIEKGIEDKVFVDYHKVNDLFTVTRTATLHQIANSNRHAMLTANPSAVEKMHRCNFYPIVIYIKHKSLRQVKEVKDPKFLPERLSSRSAKDLFEHFQKLEMEHKSLFTVEIQGSNMAAMSQDIKRAIDEEQTKYVWIQHTN